MMNIVHHSGGPFNIPKCDAIKRRVIKMGEETIDGVREMFRVSTPYSHCMLYL